MESQFKKGVSLFSKYDKSISYRVSCDCQDHEHESIIDFEIDKDFGMISLTFYKDISFPILYIYKDVLWGEDLIKELKQKHIFKAIKILVENTIIYWIKNFWCRFKNATRLLFTGYLEMNSDFLLQEDDHIDNVISALQEGRDMMRQLREEKGK